ncbi:MAG: methyltransferase domain-containing protein [Smithella sp.]
MALGRENTELSAKQLNHTHGQYFFSRQKKLILELLSPCAGEKMLCIGDDLGDYLQIFQDKWCQLTGFVSSEEILRAARRQTGEGIELYCGEFEDLPFSDDEFDVVFIIKALETARSPQKVIAEATRVCCGRVFIGFFNKYSFAGIHQNLKRMFGFPFAENTRSFSIDEIKDMAGGLIDIPAIKWGSVIYFPTIIYNMARDFEELVPYMKNPLGSFVGLTFPVKYIYRTVQSPLVESHQLKAGARTIPETVRSMLQNNDR